MDELNQTGQAQSRGPREPTPLSELVLRLRDERGLSSYELARQSGIDRGHLRRIETGEVANVSSGTMQKLAEALEADVELFYEAHWQTTGQPLPSLPTYFRTKHRALSDDDIADIEAFVQQREEDSLRQASQFRDQQTGPDELPRSSRTG